VSPHVPRPPPLRPGAAAAGPGPSAQDAGAQDARKAAPAEGGEWLHTDLKLSVRESSVSCEDEHAAPRTVDELTYENRLCTFAIPILNNAGQEARHDRRLIHSLMRSCAQPADSTSHRAIGDARFRRRPQHQTTALTPRCKTLSSSSFSSAPPQQAQLLARRCCLAAVPPGLA
jgi:hypothetical protein